MQDANAEKPGIFSPAVRNYALSVLVVVYTFNFIDRQILSILLEPIKQDLGLSDSALGMLTGFAFALFYATLGIPIARFADRGNRRNLIALALTIWSGMTALSGVAQNFWHLLLARIGVGVGEAGCSPPAHSMIADYFPAENRATALGIYSLGIPFGILFGFIAGGWLNEFFGWRVAFFVVGIPGLLLALLVRYTLREPPRGMAEGRVAEAEQPWRHRYCAWRLPRGPLRRSRYPLVSLGRCGGAHRLRALVFWRVFKCHRLRKSDVFDHPHPLGELLSSDHVFANPGPCVAAHAFGRGGRPPLHFEHHRLGRWPPGGRHSLGRVATTVRG